MRPTIAAVFWTGVKHPFGYGCQGARDWTMSMAIRWFSRLKGHGFPAVHHQGLAFADQQAWREVHEALGGTGWSVKPWEKLMHFRRRPGTVMHVRLVLHMSTAAVQAMYEHSLRWAGVSAEKLQVRSGKRPAALPYDHWQNARTAVVRSLAGRALRLDRLPAPEDGSPDDRDAVNCCEGASYLLWRYGGPDLRAGRGWNELTPQWTLDHWQMPSMEGCERGSC